MKHLTLTALLWILRINEYAWQVKTQEVVVEYKTKQQQLSSFDTKNISAQQETRRYSADIVHKQRFGN